MRMRNAKYTSEGKIDVEIEHDIWGWIPFTASPNDEEEFGREVFELAKVGVVLPYEGN